MPFREWTQGELNPPDMAYQASQANLLGPRPKLLYHIYDESFVPIWDGKIEGVVGEIKKLKEEDVKIKKRLEVIEKKIR